MSWKDQRPVRESQDKLSVGPYAHSILEESKSATMKTSEQELEDYIQSQIHYSQSEVALVHQSTYPTPLAIHFDNNGIP